MGELEIISDISNISGAELMQRMWREREMTSFAQTELGSAKAELLSIKEQLKAFEMRFRYIKKDYPKEQVSMSMAADKTWLSMKQKMTRLEAFVIALGSRVDAYSDRVKTLSRELTRRGIEAELQRKGI